jgi:hypothetical protein
MPETYCISKVILSAKGRRITFKMQHEDAHG